MRRALLLALVALAVTACGSGDDETPTLASLETELICPTCNTTLEMSDAPVADRMRAFIVERIEAGDSESEIKDALVAQFGEEVLASPPKEGFNLLAWVLPLGGVAVAVAGLGVALRRWSRRRQEATVEPAFSENGGPPVDPELERRLDEELARFDG